MPQIGLARIALKWKSSEEKDTIFFSIPNKAIYKKIGLGLSELITCLV